MGGGPVAGGRAAQSPRCLHSQWPCAGLRAALTPRPGQGGSRMSGPRLFAHVRCTRADLRICSGSCCRSLPLGCATISGLLPGLGLRGPRGPLSIRQVGDVPHLHCRKCQVVLNSARGPELSTPGRPGCAHSHVGRGSARRCTVAAGHAAAGRAWPANRGGNAPEGKEKAICKLMRGGGSRLAGSSPSRGLLPVLPTCWGAPLSGARSTQAGPQGEVLTDALACGTFWACNGGNGEHVQLPGAWKGDGEGLRGPDSPAQPRTWECSLGGHLRMAHSLLGELIIHFSVGLESPCIRLHGCRRTK